MSLWFQQILPYLVLVIFHLNSGQVDHQAPAPSRDQPANLPQALYCPPGAPFGPVNFTKYPLNTAYSEFNLDNILIANPLARTRETKTIGHKGKWYIRPPILLKDKYNYLPTYFVPITPLLTPQPNRPMEPPLPLRPRPPSCLRLDGLHVAQLWPLVFTWVVSILPPILWWAVPCPKTLNASTYAWLPDSRGLQKSGNKPRNEVKNKGSTKSPKIKIL
ncbi:hypothetical protein DSO57_1023009 [Entomophthora muscae]|uniref:Uncharacterized protein n=1 Tax=Entomophthora muscae TaxID=34485 RepID=A0ACC2SSA1_9FUNG|nr:hypothetical protein DSO57_1023009 [Entomophthora muscae]